MTLLILKYDLQYFYNEYYSEHAHLLIEGAQKLFRLTKKVTISKKSTIFVQSSPNLVKITTC